MKKYRSFKEARKFVHKLELKNKVDWFTFSKSGKLPNDIPREPRNYYLNKGWKGWGYWLGTGNIATFERQYKSFVAARKFTHSLKLKSVVEWATYCKSGKKPKDIPSAPRNSYKKEWKDWLDWLGTDNLSMVDRKKGFKSFEEVREFIRSLGVKTEPEWREWMSTHKKPIDIPAVPARIYKKEWKGWGEFLGTGNISRVKRSNEFLPWHEAKKIYQKLAKQYGIKNLADWTRFTKTHQKLLVDLKIPAHPQIYTKERVWRNIKK